VSLTLCQQQYKHMVSGVWCSCRVSWIVSNLPKETTKEEVAEFFARCGEILQLDLPRKREVCRNPLWMHSLCMQHQVIGCASLTAKDNMP
jgi:hypothetical protein